MDTIDMTFEAKPGRTELLDLPFTPVKSIG
jgi:hypothetical protein